MAKAKTPSYTLELALQTTAQERAMLEKKLRVAKQVYNGCLHYALKQTYTKKPLSARWNDQVDGRRIQRDVYSAFLIAHTTADCMAVDVALCEKHWSTFVQLHDATVQRVAQTHKRVSSTKF